MALFPFQPESPINETLRFLTNTFDHLDGSEQRVNLRKAPRQEFELRFMVEDDVRQKFENILFGTLAAEFDLPVWGEPLMLIEDASATDTSVTVYDPASLPSDLGYTTAYNDFRSGFKAFVWQDENTYELVSDLDLSTPGEISFMAGLANSYDVGTKVYPVRPAIIKGSPKVVRHAVHLTEYTIQFCVTDNDIDIADNSAFATFNSLPLVDDPNAIADTIQELWSQNITIIDGATGLFRSVSRWDVARRGSAKTWVTTTRQRIWEIRQLLHYLRGRQKPFYLPTFSPEVEASQNLSSSNANLVVFDRGYTTYTQSRNPRNVVRIALTNGTVYNRTVQSSSQTSPTEETLVLDSNHPGNVNVADIARIDFLEKVRLDSDDIGITHNNAVGSASIGVAVRSVLE